MADDREQRHQDPIGTGGRHVPDNMVDYLVLIAQDGVKGREQQPMLERVRQTALDLAETVAKDHLWQRGNLSLEYTCDDGLAYLQGSTDYGDCIDDEWLIVFILRELTKTDLCLWVRISDDDGEFLLIEAAHVLPKWLSPEIDKNRAWIHQGKLLLIPPNPKLDSKSRGLTLSEASDIIQKEPGLMIHCPDVEAEAFDRLQDFPMRIKESIHHALATVPRKVACILHQCPNIVAPAVEAFYLREPITWTTISCPEYKAKFPVQDLVTVSVRFTRVLFAQLSSQQLSLTPSWEHAKSQQHSDGRELVADAYDIGAKLTFGLEVAVKNTGYGNNGSVTEVAVMVQELEKDGGQALPTDEAIMGWTDVHRQDDDSWLNIDFQDFEDELEGRGRPKPHNAESSFQGSRAQADLRRIVSRVRYFLNDRSAGFEGAEIGSDNGSGDSLSESDKDKDTDEDEDEEVNLDEAEFARLVKELSTSGVDSGIRNQTIQPRVHTPPSTNLDDDVVNQISSEMELELQSHGALSLETDTSAPVSSSNHEATTEYYLAKNMLESFKSQAGLAGPVGNILGMMDVHLPRDEDEGGFGWPEEFDEPRRKEKNLGRE